MIDYSLDDVGRDSELLIHHRNHRPSQIVKRPGWQRLQSVAPTHIIDTRALNLPKPDTGVSPVVVNTKSLTRGRLKSSFRAP
jgi:hypothetical protein